MQTVQDNLKIRMLSQKYAFISTDAVAFSNAHFGSGTGTIHLHVVSCTGRETNLIDCPEVRTNFYCLQGHSEDAGVRCQGSKKLQLIAPVKVACKPLLHSFCTFVKSK